MQVVIDEMKSGEAERALPYNKMPIKYLYGLLLLPIKNAKTYNNSIALFKGEAPKGVSFLLTCLLDSCIIAYH